MRALRYSIPVAIIVLLSACHSRLPIVGATHSDLPPKSADKLLEGLMAHAIPATPYYSAKVEVDLKTNTGNKNFKAHVRSVQDSAVWLSITPALGIEVARALLTADSLKVMDKIHDTYWIGDTAKASTKFGVQLRLDLFQDALLGLPVAIDLDEKYRSDREDGQYTLTIKEKRKFIRAAEDLSPGDTMPNDRDMGDRRMERTLRQAGRKDAMVYKYWIDPDSMRVDRVSIIDLAHDQQADVRYMARTSVDGRSLPTLVVLSLSAPGQQVTGTLKLDRIELNGPFQLPFRIPEKFLPME